MLTGIFDIWIRYTYVHTNKWSRSCSEEGMLTGSAPTRLLKGKPYAGRREARTQSPLSKESSCRYSTVTHHICPPHMSELHILNPERSVLATWLSLRPRMILRITGHRPDPLRNCCGVLSVMWSALVRYAVSSTPGTDPPARRPIIVLLHALFFVSFSRFFIDEKRT